MDPALGPRVANRTKAGYRGPVALAAFCTTCQRTVYIEDGDTAECPVCSSPLMEATDPREETEKEAQAGGSK